MARSTRCGSRWEAAYFVVAHREKRLRSLLLSRRRAIRGLMARSARCGSRWEAAYFVVAHREKRLRSLLLSRRRAIRRDSLDLESGMGCGWSL
jgi:hypothetical protein